MRNTILDRVARLLILGALSTGAVGTLSAQQTILNGPADVKSNSVAEANIWHLKAGNYSATDTAAVGLLPYQGVLDGGLGVDGKVTLKVRGNDEFLSGLAVRDDVLISENGILTANASAGGRGLFVQNGNFVVTSGTVMVYADGYEHSASLCSAGLLLAGEDADGGSFIQGGGAVAAGGQNGGDGIVIARGDYTLQNGELDARGKDKTFIPGPDGTRITIRDGIITYSGGGTDYYGCGVVLKDGDFTMSGGVLRATGENGGCGIVIENGNFRQNGGEFYVGAGDGKGLAAMTVNGDASFGSDGVTLLQVDPGQGHIGTIYVSGNVDIAAGAQLDVCISKSSTLLDKDRPVSGTFLKMEKTYDDPLKPTATGTISGEFSTPGAESMTLLYEIEKSADSKQYDLTLQRKAWVSEVVDGNSARLARAMERVLPNLSYTQYAALHAAYFSMDVAESAAEINAVARGLTPWQATQFARVSAGLVDMTQDDVSRNLNAMRSPQVFCDPCGEVDGCGRSHPRHLWFAGHGNFAHYGSQLASIAALDVDSWGMNVGVARKLPGLGRNTVAGIGFQYTNGNIDGSLSDTDFDYYGFLGSVKTDLQRFQGWAELSAGYSRADFDQNRYDIEGYRHGSDVDQDIVRLGVNLGRDFQRQNLRFTPVAGLEYTMISQDGYSERSWYSPYDLTVGGDTINSLRLRFGLEGAVKRRDFTLTAQGFLRYETLDRETVLDSYFRSAQMLRFQTRGQRIDRCSGTTGLRLDWRLNALTEFITAYDLTVGDGFTEQRVNLGLRRSW